jgi:hypothetical protein
MSLWELDTTETFHVSLNIDVSLQESRQETHHTTEINTSISMSTSLCKPLISELLSGTVLLHLSLTCNFLQEFNIKTACADRRICKGRAR